MASDAHHPNGQDPRDELDGILPSEREIVRQSRARYLAGGLLSDEVTREGNVVRYVVLLDGTVVRSESPFS